MIRTVIQQRNSYTITLPKKWADRHELKDKTPLSVEEDDFSNKLVITPLYTAEQEKPQITVDVEHLDYKDVKVVVFQNYRLGYDIIQLTNVEDNIQTQTEDLATELVGFTSSRKKNTITFEMLNSDQYDEKRVDSLLRKLFFIIEQTYSQPLIELEGIKHDMDTHTNYLRRTIAKYDHGGKSSYQYYSLTNFLALVQHAVYRSRTYSKDKNIKQLLQQSNEMFQYLEKGLFEKDLTILSEVDDRKDAILKEIHKHMKTHPQDYVQQLYEQVRMIHMSMPSAKGIILTQQ